MSLFATKPISKIIAEAAETGEHTLKKTLTSLDLTMLGVENCPDTQVLAQQFVVAQCGNDLLSDQGIAQVRALHQRFRTWSDGLRYALTFHAELP